MSKTYRHTNYIETKVTTTTLLLADRAATLGLTFEALPSHRQLRKAVRRAERKAA
jgi:hypothetical protein